MPGAYEICPNLPPGERRGPVTPADQGRANKVSSEDWAAENRSLCPADRSALRWWLPTFWRRDHQ